jgi:MFS family permease
VQAEEGVTERAVKSPRIFYGWYIVGTSMAIHLWMSIIWVYGMQVFFNPILTTFGWSRTALSGAFSLQRLEGSIEAPILGFMLDRFGPRRIIVGGAFIGGLGLISLSFMQSLWMFYVSVLLTAVGTSACIGQTRNWSIVQWFRRKRGRALGIGACGAVFSGPLLVITLLLVENLGWRAAFLVTGVGTWVLIIPLSTVFRSRPEDYGLLPDGDLPELDAEPTSHGGIVEKEEEKPALQGSQSESGAAVPSTEVSLSARQALGTRAFWTLTIIFGAHAMGTSALGVHQIPYFESIGFTTAQAVSVLGFYTVFSALGRLGAGWAMDFFDRRMVIAGLLILQAGSFLILANINAYWQVIPFALFYGVAFGGFNPGRGAIISAFFGPRNFGAIQGLTHTVTVLGGMAGPILMGLAFDITESYVLAVYIIMLVTAAAIPLAFMTRPPRV